MKHSSNCSIYKHSYLLLDARCIGRLHSAIIKRNVKADENTFDKDNNAATLGGVEAAHIEGDSGCHQTKEFGLFQPTFSGISNATLTTKSCCLPKANWPQLSFLTWQDSFQWINFRRFINNLTQVVRKKSGKIWTMQQEFYTKNQ